MKRLLFLLALTIAAPQPAISAENYYLIWVWYRGINVSGVVPMETLDACEMAGARLKASKRFRAEEDLQYECVAGK